VFLGFSVEPGVSKVVVDYRPVSWIWSLGLALLGGLMLAGIGVRRESVVQRPDTGSDL
jgi:hypothetical protein